MVHVSLSQGGFQQEGLWEVGHLPFLASPKFSWLVFGGSTISLLGPPVVSQLKQGDLPRGGWFWSTASQ